MTFKYNLPASLIEKVSHLEQFANGGTQVTVKLKNGSIHRQVLISNSTWIVAMRDQDDLPFEPAEIEDIFQNEEDKNPKERGGWKFWDDWGVISN
jgi:hypothetical protein